MYSWSKSWFIWTIHEVSERKYFYLNINFDYILKTIFFLIDCRECMDYNLLGTKHVIDICHQIKDLSCFIHCSTAYSHCQRPEIDEIFYEMSTDPNELIRLSRWISIHFSINLLFLKCFDFISQLIIWFLTNTTQIYRFVISNRYLVNNVIILSHY